VIDTVMPVVTGGITDQPSGFGPPAIASIVGAGSVYRWSAGGLSLLPGMTCTFTITGAIGAICAPVWVTNTAYVYAGMACRHLDTLTNGVYLQVLEPATSLTVVKTQSPASPGVGEPVTYQITVKNTGAMTIGNLVVIDTVSPVIVGATTDQPGGFVAPSVTAINPTGTLYTWSANVNMTPGTAYTFTVAGLAGIVCAPTTIGGAAMANGNAVTGAACGVSRVVAAAVSSVVQPPVIGVAVSKKQTPASLQTGDVVTYEVTVVNTGTATITSLVVVDTVSPVIIGVTTSAPTGFLAPVVVPSASGTMFMWRAGLPWSPLAMTPGTSYTFTMTGVAGVVCTPTTVGNTAYIQAATECTVTKMFTGRTEFSLSVPQLNLSVVKSQNPAVLTIGDPVVYTIVVTNTGAATMASLAVYDTLSPVIVNPVTIQPIGWGPASIASVPGSGTRYLWTSSASPLDMFPGASLTFQIQGQVGSVCAPTAVSNASQAVGAWACSSTSLHSNMLSAMVQPASLGIAVSKRQTPASPNIGDPITYELTVFNKGTATVTNLVVTDTILPVIVSVTTQGPIGLPAPAVIQSGSGTLYAWNITNGFLVPGDSYTFTIAGTIGVVCTQTIVANTAYVSAFSSECDVTSTRMFTNRTEFGLMEPSLSLAVVKSQSTPNPKTGEPMSYTVQVTNTGGATLENLIVVDTLPPQMTAVTTVQSAPFAPPVVTSVPGVGTRYVWSVPVGLNMTPGLNHTFQMNGVAGLVCASTALSNEAVVSTYTPCSATRVVSSPVTATIAPPALGITVVKTQIPAVPTYPGPVRYEIVVANVGSATITSLTVTDSVSPVAWNMLPSQPGGWLPPVVASVPGRGTRFVWSNGAGFQLLPGSSLTFALDGTVGVMCQRVTVTNTAYVTAGSACAAVSATRFSNEVRFETGANFGMTVVKSNSSFPAFPQVGAPVSYWIEVSNTGDAPLDNIMVIDTVAPQVTGATWTSFSKIPAGADEFLPPVVTQGASGTIYTWNLAGGQALDPGQTYRLELTGKIGLVCAPVSISNAATVKHNTLCGTTSMTYALPGFTVTPPTTGIAVSKRQLRTDGSGNLDWSRTATVTAGETVTYQINVRNTGSATLTEVMVTDTLASYDNGTLVPGSPLVNLVADQPAGFGPPTITQMPTSGTLFSWGATGLNMIPGETFTFSLTGTVDVAFKPFVESNTAYVMARSACSTTRMVTGNTYFKIRIPTTSISVVKTMPLPASGQAYTGAPIQYQIAVTNTGEATIRNLTVTDTVSPTVLDATGTWATPQMADFSISPVAGSGSRYIWKSVAGTYNWNTGSYLATDSAANKGLAPGASVILDFWGVAGIACTPAAILNSAQVTATSMYGSANVVSNAVSWGHLPVVPRLSVATDMTVGGNPNQPSGSAVGTNQIVSYLITVTNSGTDTLTELVVVDTVPAELSGVTVDIPAALGVAVVSDAFPSGTRYEWRTNTVGAILMYPGMSYTITITGTTGPVCAPSNAWNRTYAFGLGTVAPNLSPCGESRSVPVEINFYRPAPQPHICVVSDYRTAESGFASRQPQPSAGSVIRYKITATNDSATYDGVEGVGRTAANIKIVDTLPTDYVELIGNWTLPAGWSIMDTRSGTGGTLVVTFTKSGGADPGALLPGETAEFAVDVRFVEQNSEGSYTITNFAGAFYVNPCNRQPVEQDVVFDECAGAECQTIWGCPRNVAKTSITIAQPITMIVKIYNAAGELVRSYTPVQVGETPTDFRFTYTGTGACASYVGSTALPFSPDDDCTNDVLVLAFDQLIDRNGIPYQAIRWDGKNDQGVWVRSGEYLVIVESVDPQTGAPIVATKWVTLSARRVDVVARIFNAAGEEVAVLATNGLKQSVAAIVIEPNPYAPNLGDPSRGILPTPVVIKFKDAGGNWIDADNDASNGITGLLWYGRTCQNARDHVCASPTDGVVVNNGVYLVQITSYTPNGDQTKVTGAITVSHGEMELISQVQPVPNPLPYASLVADPNARVWVHYQVAGGLLRNLQVKVYNVAGELVNKYDAGLQGSPADPLGTHGSAGINCPAGFTCGTFNWSGRNFGGSVCAPGLYIIAIEAADSAGNIQRKITKVVIQ
jgi:uncharacterized repeat protein (TIGR01451 family)